MSNNQRILIACAAVFVMALGLTAAVDYTVKTKVCNAIGQIGNKPAASETNPDPGLSSQDTAKMAKDARLVANLMVFHPTLADAVRGLADDAQEAKSMSDGQKEVGLEKLPAMLLLLGSMDGHLRQARTECGLPPRSLFNM